MMGVGNFADMMVKSFEKSWLPPGLVSVFDHVLPFWEVIVGALLLLGLFRNAALFATGVLLIILTFGQVVLGQADVVFNNVYNVGYTFFAVFNNVGFTFMVAALLYLADYDQWVLFPRCRKAAPMLPTA